VTRQDWERLLDMLRSTGMEIAGADFEKGTVTLRVPNRFR
jgi:hypothetical protein